MDSAREASFGEYCAFFVNERLFAVPVHAVKEIHTPVPITTIPGAPAAVQGYVNLRGSLHLVIDPHLALSDQPRREPKDESLVVFREEVGETFAVRVDRVVGIMLVDNQDIDRPIPAEPHGSSASSEENRLVTGLAKLDQSLSMLVDPAVLYRICLQRPVETTSSSANLPLPPT